MAMDAEDGGGGDTPLRLSADIVAAYVSNNPTSTAALPDLIRAIHQSLSTLGLEAAPAAAQERRKPAVPIGRSIQEDFIVCLEDGKKLKMLKRYLRSNYNMTPEEYRAKWGLPADYPMVAPNYAAQRSEFAKKIGLGRSASSTARRRRG